MITECWAFLHDEPDGSEGLVASGVLQPGGVEWAPLITMSPNNLEKMRTAAQAIADQTGHTLKLVRFHVRKDVEQIKPKKGSTHGK